MITLVLAVTALAVGGTTDTTAAPPAHTAAVPYLSYGEAVRAIGRNLHEGFEYGAEAGSLATDCWRLARNRVRCYISFFDDYGDGWCGKSTVTKNRAFYRVQWSVEPC